MTDYRIPMMNEIRAKPHNGLNVISTFSGCGGSCLGFQMDGYRTLYASEFIPDAANTYRANHPGVFLDTRDIRKVKPDEIMSRAGVARGEIDVLEGSPPCASFSTAGKLQHGWGEVKKYSDTKQRVDDLFFEYIRIIDGLRPKVFVAENVSGMVIGKSKGYFKEILGTMRGLGYKVDARVLDAQWLDVPQRRQRLFFVGVRDDLGKSPAFPAPNTYRFSIRQALKRPPPPEFKDTAEEREYFSLRRSRCYYREYVRLKPDSSSRKYFNLTRPALDSPSFTVVAQGIPAGGTVCHPTDARKFYIWELRRISGFPDDFILTGALRKQWERLARAVPPPMMRHIASTIRSKILSAT